MHQPFEDVVKEAIAFHRAEIARLERALRAYAGSDAPTPTASVNARVKQTDDTKQRIRTSKYEKLFQAYEAERRPLSLDSMIAIAANHEFTIDRGNMRSLVHTQKSLGRARPVGEGYQWGKDATSSPGGETPTEGSRPSASFTTTAVGQKEGSTDWTDAPGVGGI